MDAGTALRHALFADIIQQRSPQLGLPATGRWQRFDFTSHIAQLVAAFRPIFQPVGPVDLILVKQVGQTL